MECAIVTAHVVEGTLLSSLVPRRLSEGKGTPSKIVFISLPTNAYIGTRLTIYSPEREGRWWS